MQTASASLLQLPSSIHTVVGTPCIVHRIPSSRVIAGFSSVLGFGLDFACFLALLVARSARRWRAPISLEYGAACSLRSC